jgi:hypothetical protein
MTPTERSKAHLKKEGWRVAVTEHWNAFAHVRQDLFGFCDILAVCPTEKPMMVQTTSMSNMSARITKILELPATKDVLRGGFTIVVHGWDGKRLAVSEIFLDRESDLLRVL